MTCALLTHADETGAGTAALTRPALTQYAQRHGYRLLTPQSPPLAGRSGHWQKIQLLREALDDHELVAWIDHDVLVRDDRADIFAGLHPSDMQALVMEQTPHGVGPNTGVWVMRSGKAARRFLDLVWETGPLPGATLNDQATVAHLLGFSYLPALTRPLHPSSWMARTGWLEPTFNALLCYHPEQATYARFLHYGGLSEPDKQQLLRYHIISQRLAGWETLLAELGAGHHPVHPSRFA